MGEKIGTEKIERPAGSLTYIGKDGYVYARPAGKGHKGVKHKISKTAITRAPGYLYYLGKSGVVERVKMKRARG